MVTIGESIGTGRSAWGFDSADPESWKNGAICAQVDPEAFFPEKGGSTKAAKKICLSCTVRQECLEEALANDERFGIWGGLSERERRKLRPPGVKRTRRQLQPPTWGPRCGTESGGKGHAQRGENTCDTCKQAATMARRRRFDG